MLLLHLWSYLARPEIVGLIVHSKLRLLMTFLPIILHSTSAVKISQQK